MTADELRRLLCALGDHVRDRVVAARDEGLAFGDVAGRSAADTIYAVDRVTDEALLAWFDRDWPADEPLELITEALDAPVVVPQHATGPVRWTCIVDPVDGTRGLMYDKRPAWVLAAIAPRPAAGPAPRLGDLTVAAMTEIPVAKQTLADQLSGVSGCGLEGLVAERVDVRSGFRTPVRVRPSPATTVEHGWASFARFFPPGKALLADFEERLWRALHGPDLSSLAVFDDQYLATGGQLHELLAGHDRVVGDLRPLAFTQLGQDAGLACHPYDCCTKLLLEEAGGVVTDPWGDPLDVPLDTTTPVAWVGYANATLAATIGPVVAELVGECFPAVSRPDRPGAAR